MQLSVEGKGNAGKHNGYNGNLLVLIEEVPHKDLVRDENDLVYNLLLTVPQAALGGAIEIPTLDGAVKASKVFDAPDASSFNAIFEYAKSKAPNLEAKLPEDMAITDVMFTQAGSFIILFKNGKIFVGNWNWKNEKTGELGYKWDGGEQIYNYESGKATFDVQTYKKVSYYTLTLSADVTDGGKDYSIKIAFNLQEK